MTWIVAGVGGFLLGGVVIAALVHLGYAWRGWQSARAAVPAAREAFYARLGAAVWSVLFVGAVVLACVWLATTGRQR